MQQNQPGSVEGLLARHILGDDPRLGIDWEVLCTQEWVDGQFRPGTLDHVAALGYSQWTRPVAAFTPRLIDGLSRIRERDAFSGEHLSLARNPTRLLGIILGCRATGDSASDTLVWCQQVLDEMKRKAMTGFDPLVFYLFFRAFDQKPGLTLSAEPSLYELAVVDWISRHQMHKSDLQLQQLREMRQGILYRTATDLRFESASQAAFIWSSAIAALVYALEETSLQPKHVAAVLRNFEPGMKRWRWDAAGLQKPIHWPVTQEREVQDILWLILRSYFPDVVDEDTLPKLGHSTYRADFGIASLKLTIEVKYATCRDDFKKIEKEIQEDCVPYLRDLRYESLIVFIYDESASVQEHDITRSALLESQGWRTRSLSPDHRSCRQKTALVELSKKKTAKSPGRSLGPPFTTFRVSVLLDRIPKFVISHAGLGVPELFDAFVS